MRLGRDSRKSLEGFVFGVAVGSSLAVSVALVVGDKPEDFQFGSLTEIWGGVVALCIGLYSLSVAREAQRRQRRMEEKSAYIALSRAHPPLSRIRSVMRVVSYSLRHTRSEAYNPEQMIRGCKRILGMKPVELIQLNCIDSDLPFGSSKATLSLRFKSEDWALQLDRFCKAAAGLQDEWRMLQASGDQDDLYVYEIEVGQLRAEVSSYIDLCIEALDDAIGAIERDAGLFDTSTLEREWRESVMHQAKID